MTTNSKHSHDPDLLDGCNALLGLLQLLCGRPDAPDWLKKAMESHRVEEARAAIAKARLIAAAPELLEALELCIEDAERQIKADAPGVAPDWYNAARAAIAKVKERSA